MSNSPINEIPETPPENLPRTPSPRVPETPLHLIQWQAHNPWASRDRRKKILPMTNLGYSQRAIAAYLKVTRRIVQYTQQIEQATPTKPKGQPPKLHEEQVDEIIEFISASKQNRRTPYYRIIDILQLDISCHALRCWNRGCLDQSELYINAIMSNVMLIVGDDVIENVYSTDGFLL